MALIKFTRNYNDHSTDSGFQFEFFCDRCGSGYQSTFQGSASSTVTNVLDVASGLFGGLLGNVADAGHRVHSTAWEKQHDQEFQKTVEEVKPFFKDGAAVAAAMKIEPVITFDMAKFNDIKAELIKRAEAKHG